MHFGSNNWLDSLDTVTGVGEVQGAARTWTNGVDCGGAPPPPGDCCDPVFIDTHDFEVTATATGDTTGVPMPPDGTVLSPSGIELDVTGSYTPVGGGDEVTLNFFWRPDEPDHYCVSGDITGFLLVNVTTLDCDNCTWVFTFPVLDAVVTLNITVAS